MHVIGHCDVLKILSLDRIRGTVEGANNRLDFSRLVTTGVNKSEISNHQGSLLGFLEGWPEDETHDPDVPAISHSRGLSPCVFVPFNEVVLLCLQLLYLGNIFRPLLAYSSHFSFFAFMLVLVFEVSFWRKFMYCMKSPCFT